MFAVITPALISGAFAERMRFGPFLLFTILWATLVYNTLAHWVWADGGWLKRSGALDFAGGIAVHLSSGVAASAFVATHLAAGNSEPCYRCNHFVYFVVTYSFLKAVDVMVGLHISEEDEARGLDLSQHSEVGYNF